jgi:hypothetical protein
MYNAYHDSEFRASGISPISVFTYVPVVLQIEKVFDE